jgi:type IV pilus assembly protein PilN
MIRINLLPHRAEKRKRRKIQFAALCGVSVLAGVVLVGLGYGAMQARIFYQSQRNAYLNSEIAKLDKQIEEIKRLRQQVKALLARKEVVEKLQSKRSDVVHLMDQMLRILPQGVYISSLTQNGNAIKVSGYAQSSARVSTLMHAIDESPWLDSPHLIEVQAATVRNLRTNQFTMTFNLSKEPPPAPPAPPQGAKTGTTKPAPAASAPAAATPAPAPAAAHGGAASAPIKTGASAPAAAHGATPRHAPVLGKKR